MKWLEWSGEMFLHYSPTNFSLVQIKPSSNLHTHSSVIVINKFCSFIDGKGNCKSKSRLLRERDAEYFASYEINGEIVVWELPSENTSEHWIFSLWHDYCWMRCCLRCNIGRKNESTAVCIVVTTSFFYGLTEKLNVSYKENYLDANKIWARKFFFPTRVYHPLAYTHNKRAIKVACMYA